MIDGVRGTNPALEAIFDQIYGQGIADLDEQVRRGPNL